MRKVDALPFLPGTGKQLLFHYTWNEQQRSSLMDRLDEKRKSMGIDEDRWVKSLEITDSSGNAMDLFDRDSGPDTFPVTVTLDATILYSEPTVLDEYKKLDMLSNTDEIPKLESATALQSNIGESPPVLFAPPNIVDESFDKNWDMLSNTDEIPKLDSATTLQSNIGETPTVLFDDLLDTPESPPWNGSKCIVEQCSFINLDRRIDRKRRIEEGLQSADVQCNRMQAVDAKTSQILPVDACRRSHINALQKLAASNATYGLILEDDAQWQVERSALQGHLCNIHNHIKEHPVILLACNLDGHSLGHTLENAWLRSTGNCQTSSAYVVRRDYAQRLLRLFRDQDPTSAIDQTWKSLQVHDNWAMTWPVLVKQAEGYSDIQGANENYGVFAQT